MRRSEVIVNRLLEAEGQPGDEAEKCLPVPPEEAEVNHFKWPPIVPRSHTSFQYDQGRKTRPPDEHFEFDIPAPAANPVKPEQQRLALEATCDLVDNLLDEPGSENWFRISTPDDEPEDLVQQARDHGGMAGNTYTRYQKIKGTALGQRINQSLESLCQVWNANLENEAVQAKVLDEVNFIVYKQLQAAGLMPQVDDEPDDPNMLESEDAIPSDEPADARSEMDRLLPTTQSRLRGNSMIHAPGVIHLAQMRWRERSKAAKKNGMDIIKAWQGLPEERYLRILNNDRITIETDGDDAIITFRDY